ncbi:MAG: hypothetical protein IKV93_01235 [Alphaproteobacteria bacterium]|nr:hypothetical protein [Alphaproteobacteria bacterium]
MKKILIFMLLCGCGFTPMFVGQDTDIYIPPISGINGIELRNALNGRFGGSHESDARYTLTVTLNEPVTQYKALERTGDATWQEVLLRASYKLSDTQTGRVITTGNAIASESYTFVRYLVASNASYNNAVRNSLLVLADKISTHVLSSTHNLAVHKSDTDGQK